MKYLRSLGLLTVAAAALMAFAGPASATTVTSSEGTTPNITAEANNLKFDFSAVTVECGHSTLKGNVESHGAGTVEGLVDAFSLEECNYAMTINNRGSLQIHASSTTGDGTLTWTGASVTIHTSVGICTFTTNGTDVGTIDGGSPAVWNINSSKLPRTAGNFLCGQAITWTGSYKVTSPSTLEVH